jgi:ATP-dependent protease ClpP protease subunit
VRINGLVIGVPQTYSYFEKMQNRIVDFIVRNSRADGDVLRKLMCRTDELTTDIGTVLEGSEAVEKGIIDCVGGLGDAVAALKEMMRKNEKHQ